MTEPVDFGEPVAICVDVKLAVALALGDMESEAIEERVGAGERLEVNEFALDLLSAGVDVDVLES